MAFGLWHDIFLSMACSVADMFQLFLSLYIFINYFRCSYMDRIPKWCIAYRTYLPRHFYNEVNDPVIMFDPSNDAVNVTARPYLFIVCLGGKSFLDDLNSGLYMIRL